MGEVYIYEARRSEKTIGDCATTYLPYKMALLSHLPHQCRTICVVRHVIITRIKLAMAKIWLKIEWGVPPIRGFFYLRSPQKFFILLQYIRITLIIPTMHHNNVALQFHICYNSLSQGFRSLTPIHLPAKDTLVS